jgi:hypothetical protein
VVILQNNYSNVSALLCRLSTSLMVYHDERS